MVKIDRYFFRFRNLLCREQYYNENPAKCEQRGGGRRRRCGRPHEKRYMKVLKCKIRFIKKFRKPI
jgi:hypothetical protein